MAHLKWTINMDKEGKGNDRTNIKLTMTSM